MMRICAAVGRIWRILFCCFCSVDVHLGFGKCFTKYEWLIIVFVTWTDQVKGLVWLFLFKLKVKGLTCLSNAGLTTLIESYVKEIRQITPVQRFLKAEMTYNIRYPYEFQIYAKMYTPQACSPVTETVLNKEALRN